VGELKETSSKNAETDLLLPAKFVQEGSKNVPTCKFESKSTGGFVVDAR